MPRAGGNWNNATNCGSRSRNSNNYRWDTTSNIGGRFRSDTGGLWEVNSKLQAELITLFAPIDRDMQNTKRRRRADSSMCEPCSLQTK